MISYVSVAASGVEWWWFENGRCIVTLFRVARNFHFIANNFQSIVNPITFFGNNLPATVGRSVYGLLAFLLGDIVPGFCDSFPVFDHALRRPFVVSVEPFLEKGPHVLYGV